MLSHCPGRSELTLVKRVAKDPWRPAAARQALQPAAARQTACAATWVPSPGPAQGRAVWAAWSSEAAFGAYAEAHLAALEAAADVERLQALAATVRRSCRPLRHAPEARPLCWKAAP